MVVTEGKNIFEPRITDFTTSNIWVGGCHRNKADLRAVLILTSRSVNYGVGNGKIVHSRD